MIKTIKKTVTTAGTRVALSATSRKVLRCTVQAEIDNTGRIYVGGSDVAAANGIELDPGMNIPIEGANVDLADLYIDADANAQSVRVLYDE